MFFFYIFVCGAADTMMMLYVARHSSFTRFLYGNEEERGKVNKNINSEIKFMRHNNDNKYDTHNKLKLLSLSSFALFFCVCYEKCEKCEPRPYKSI